MEKEIASFEKNSAEEVRIKLQDYKGRTFIDLRVWTKPEAEGGEAKPTHKGLTLSVDLLPELRKAIDKALAEIEIGRDEVKKP
jgi:hypothetical protein